MEALSKKRLSGLIFSDLGQAGAFMSLDWVRRTLQEKLGFSPYPATLNLRVSGKEAALWEEIQRSVRSVDFPPGDPSFCSARLFRVGIERPGAVAQLNGAVLVPQVKGYPGDKVEVIAPLRLKDHFGIGDGDRIDLEFLD